MTSPAARPPRWQEAVGLRLFLALSPRLGGRRPPEPPPELAPFEPLEVPRERGGALAATWYPATASTSDRVRGAVLLLHPWTPLGRAYFHRRGRLEALRAAGYHALTVDLAGFGGSGRPAGFFDRDVAAAVECLADLAPGLPLHLWGVSFGGYWAHPVLGRSRRIAGAMFEDVSPHLLEWSWRVAPWGRPAYAVFRRALPAAYRFLDMRCHAPGLPPRAVAYVGGAADAGVPPEETRVLARLAGGDHRIVPGAPHLGAIKMARAAVLETALGVFERAVSLAGRPESAPGRAAVPCPAGRAGRG